MENLQFSAEGDRYVSPPLTGGDSQVIAFQLKYDKPGANVVVEYALDPSMGWKAADQKTAGINHADVVVGVPAGVYVRVTTDCLPVESKYIND